MCGYFTSILCDRFGCGIVLSGGGALVGLGSLASSFSPNTSILFITYGIITAVGTSCLYFSSLLCLPLYFRKHLGFANGFASAGGGIGGMFLTPFFNYCIEYYGISKTFQLYAIFGIIPLFGGIIIRRRRSNKSKEVESSYVCKDRCPLIKNKAFILYTLALSLTLFVYYVPYVHLVRNLITYTFHSVYIHTYTPIHTYTTYTYPYIRTHTHIYTCTTYTYTYTLFQ